MPDGPNWLILLHRNPKARTHQIFGGTRAGRSLLDEHTDRLWGELSYRFERYSDRFLPGSDTWINERWFGYDTIFKEYRGWLAQVPLEQVRRIAPGNVQRLFETAARN